MGWIEYYKPVIVMLVLQFTYAALSVSARASLLQGLSPRVFVFYRQAFGTLFITPIAYFFRTKTKNSSMGWKSFSLIFIAALIGVTGNQMIQYEGMYLASSSAASALANIIPAITFVAASIVGFEPIDIRSFRTIAKILGTVVCVTGAITMSLIKGPKLLNEQLPSSNSLLVINPIGRDNLWLVGCLCLFVGCCCWSFWLIIQVPVTRIYPDHLSLSAWMCFIGTMQCGFVTLFTDPYLEAWKIKSYFQLGTCLYAGIVGSGISIFAQAWVIERRGPVFSAMFNPLNTIIVTIFASIFLQEQIYIGRQVEVEKTLKLLLHSFFTKKLTCFCDMLINIINVCLEEKKNTSCNLVTIIYNTLLTYLMQHLTHILVRSTRCTSRYLFLFLIFLCSNLNAYNLQPIKKNLIQLLL